MKSTLLAIFLVLLSQVSADTPLVGTLGVAVTISGAGTTTINYGLSTVLVITTNAASSVTLSSYTSASANVPPGFEVLKFDTTASAQTGFTFEVSPSSAFVSANLQTPSITAASALEIVAGSSVAGILYIQASATTSSAISAPGYNLSSTSFSFPLPGLGTYIFVSQSVSVPIPSYYGEARAFTSSVVTTVNYTGNFILSANPTANVQITVTYSSSATTTASAPEGYSALGAYFNISESSETNFNSASLVYFYSDAQIAAAGVINETSVVFCYLNSNNQWQIDGTTTVNSNNNTLSQSVTHFSHWGVYGRSSKENAGSVFTPSLALLGALSVVIIQMF